MTHSVYQSPINCLNALTAAENYLKITLSSSVAVLFAMNVTIHQRLGEIT
ncbi:MAG: hypothetical protein H0Z28_07360 [Archaeoglobus sp.]|nr:hypothetical protein [Archaeoglobus sp.]